MPNFMLATLLKWLSRFLLVCLPMTGAYATPSVSLANSSLSLEYDLKNASVTHWRLPNLQDANGLAHDMVGAEGGLFALTGKLVGKDLQEWERLSGGWKIQKATPDTLVLILEPPQQPFRLLKTWQLREQNWRVDFSIDLELTDPATFTDSHLQLQVGPGIGEVPAHGLGMGQSIYSFTELAYHNADGVQTRRLYGTDEPVVSSDAGNPDWVGLQSRYLALVLGAANKPAEQAIWQASAPRLSEAQTELEPFETSITFELPLSSTAGTQSFHWNLFGGGKAYQALGNAEPNLENLMFSSLWGWMRGLSLGIMHVLTFIQQFVGSWGVAIILLAFLIRLIMYPMAQKTISAQKKFAAIQARIQPELQEIRRNYKGGEQSERILQLYEQHRVSPLAGLKPLLIVLVQVPVFVALFHLLGQTFELRNASFLWIKTLAEPDQLFPLGIDLPLFGAYFNLLPVLMAFTTLLSIKLASVPDGSSATRQAISSGLMGLAFFVLFYSFPSGMVLYWTVANILQVAHQKIVKN